MMDSSSLTVGGLLLAILIALAFWFSSHGRSLPHPPGPKGWPIIGNALQMPHDRLWEKALEWSKTYGDVVYLENFGKPLLLINTYDAAVELLSNRSMKYANRPPFIMAELERWDWLTSIVPYGERHKKQRAFQHRFLNSLELVNYLEIQLQETHVLLRGILANPKDYAKHIRRLPGAVVMKNFYGHIGEKSLLQRKVYFIWQDDAHGMIEVGDENDPFIQLGEVALKAVTEAEDYLFLDSLPWIRHLPEWLPWVEFPRVAREVRNISRAVINDMPRKMMAENATTPSMMSILVNENTGDDGTITDEEEIGAATASLYIAGVDTSVTALMTFVLGMLRYPEVQERARAEINQVVGEQRLPSFEDIENLPYIRAICTEVLRWQSILPLLVAHYSTEDDEYNGFLIPAGTIVLANVWAMNRNPLHFPDPTEFRPERWLELTDKKGHSRPPRPENFIFGFGRRACLGQKWAEHLLFIAVASMISAFKFDRKYKDGIPIPLHDKYEGRFLWHLGPSECNITPRSENMINLIRNANNLNV